MPNISFNLVFGEIILKLLQVASLLLITGIYLQGCRGRDKITDDEQVSQLSTVRIGQFSPKQSSGIPNWQKMDLVLQRISPSEETINRSFENKSADIDDPGVRVTYGTYRFLLSYFDQSNMLLYESCQDEKQKEHLINQPEYRTQVRICLASTGEDIGVVDSEANVVIEPEIVNQDKGEASSFVAKHGFLKAVNGNIVDQNNQIVQLKGMSLFWSHWSSQFWNGDVVKTLATDWNATLIRAAMGVEEGGYLTNPQAEKDRVNLIVEQAIKHGIYVIIDWHDHQATNHPDQALAFFSEMAERYADTPNVIFEVFNEPIQQSWPEVKSYAETIISAIRSKGAKQLVIVGSPTWSQRVDLAADDPVNDSNVAYTLHFYAATHKQDLRDKAQYAIDKGLTLFVTEFGVCDASGNGTIDLAETDIWMAFLDQHNISWANWSLNDKDESASALKPGASPQGGWTDNDLTVSGAYIKQKIAQGKN